MPLLACSLSVCVQGYLLTAVSLCVLLACGKTAGGDNTIDQMRWRYVLKCLSSFKTNLQRKKIKSVFWSEVRRARLHSGILTNLFHDNLEQSSYVPLQLNQTEHVVASRLEDSKSYLHLLLCPKLKASSSLYKVRETEPACPERILCLRYLSTSVHSLWPFIQHGEGSLKQFPYFLFRSL